MSAKQNGPFCSNVCRFVKSRTNIMFTFYMMSPSVILPSGIFGLTKVIV